MVALKPTYPTHNCNFLPYCGLFATYGCRRRNCFSVGCRRFPSPTRGEDDHPRSSREDSARASGSTLLVEQRRLLDRGNRLDRLSPIQSGWSRVISVDLEITEEQAPGTCENDEEASSDLALQAGARKAKRPSAGFCARATTSACCRRNMTSRAGRSSEISRRPCRMSHWSAPPTICSGLTVRSRTVRSARRGEDRSR